MTLYFLFGWASIQRFGASINDLGGVMTSDECVWVWVGVCVCNVCNV